MKFSDNKAPYQDSDFNELHSVACDLGEAEATRANAIQCMSIIGASTVDVEFMPHSEIISTYLKGGLISE